MLLLFPTSIVKHVTHTQRDCGKVERGRSARIYDNVLQRFRVDAQNSAYIIRIPQLHRIRIWTESWNLKDYDTRRAFMYPLIERKPAHGNNEHRILDYTKYWIQKCWIIQKKMHFENFAK